LVKLHLKQARRRNGGNRQPADAATLLTMLWRYGLTRPNSTQAWAALHQYRQDGTALVPVLDTPDAQAAAREAVAAGHVTVGEGDSAFIVPVSWAPTTQPAGSVVVTLHNLPPQYAWWG
jgi:hypothetical protein